MVTKGPIVAAASLLVQGIITLVFPNNPALRLFCGSETFLHYFWFHVDEDSIRSEDAALFTLLFFSFLSSSEVSFNEALSNDFAAFFGFFKDCLKKALAKLVTALSDL